MNRGSSEGKGQVWQATGLSWPMAAAKLGGGGELGKALNTQED